MNPALPKTDNKQSRQLLLPVVAVCVLAGICAVLFNAEKSAQFLSVDGLPQETGAEILVETKTSTNVLPFANGSAKITEQLRDALSPPYKITASMRLPDDRYRDFIFALDKTGKQLAVRIDGFHAGDKISLALDGKTVEAAVPADWSGRLELNTDIPADSKTAKACIKVDGKEGSVDVCHTITGAQTS